MIHDRFNIDDWLPQFPLGDFPLSADIITSPSHICVIEQIRAKLRRMMKLERGAPTDVFIMAKGEPTKRHVTKLCGVPYRPAEIPWPTRKGAPMLFLAQLCFADSKDITGDLPGDV